MAGIEFDYAQAKTLESNLKGKVDEMKAALVRIQTTIEGCRTWWQGGSEEGLIQNFSNTKEEIGKGLDRWLNDYATLINKYANWRAEREQCLKERMGRA